MRSPTARRLRQLVLTRQYSTSTTRPPIVRITNGTFYRLHPTYQGHPPGVNDPLFRDLNFELPSFPSKPEYWAVVGPSSAGKTTFLQILRGQHVCIPPPARSYPYLESDEIEQKNHEFRQPNKAIKHVGFDGEQGLGAQAPQTAYLSARYESRREDTDFSVLEYLQGNTELNPLQQISKKTFDDAALERVIRDLRLGDLINMPVSNLSNGQTRRARIAKALLGSPEVLLLDEPFMGLDPPTLLTLSPMLYGLAKASSPRLVLSLRPQDPIPDWITHLIYLKGSCQIAFQGLKEEVLEDLRDYARKARNGILEADPSLPIHSMHEVGRQLTSQGVIEPAPLEEVGIPVPELPSKSIGQDEQPESDSTITSSDSYLSRDGYKLHDTNAPKIGEPLVEMEGARVAYGEKAVLGNWTQQINGEEKEGVWWTVRRGERWGIFGPNGSGKTTILSLICSDHPQTYSLPIRLFGRSRLPEPGQPGISIFAIQSRIGHSSPEIHNHMPKSLTLRRVLANAWADTFRGKPVFDADSNDRIDACLRWFEEDLRPGGMSSAESGGDLSSRTDWADQLPFGGLPFSSQRIALFLRAVIKHPDLVILDEAFSGMDDGVRDRCLLFLAHGETKQFSTDVAQDGEGGSERKIVESTVSKAGQVKVAGLKEDQALLCISHVREEIPGSIREWLCLPEANTGNPARFGRLNGPIEGDYRRWNEIWGM